MGRVGKVTIKSGGEKKGHRNVEPKKRKCAGHLRSGKKGRGSIKKAVKEDETIKKTIRRRRGGRWESVSPRRKSKKKKEKNSWEPEKKALNRHEQKSLLGGLKGGTSLDLGPFRVHKGGGWNKKAPIKPGRRKPRPLGEK